MNGNENDAVDMVRLISACNALREKFGLAVLGIHHAGKDRERGMRGSTALPGASDTIIEVATTEMVMCVTVRKQKDDEPLPPFYMQMVKVPTDPLNAQTSIVLKMLQPEDVKPEPENHNPTREQITVIFDEIERAWRAKHPWSNVPQTRHEGRYLPAWITNNTSATIKDAQSWVDDWLTNGCLEAAIIDTHTRKRGLRVISRPGTYTRT